MRRVSILLRSGTTLPELLVALTVAGLLLALAAVPTTRARDALAVRAARAELAAVFASARAQARVHGGVRVVVRPAAARIDLLTAAGDTLAPVLELGRRYGVRLEAGAGTVELRYDGLGIGRAASRTLTLVRGGERGGIAVSSYGRVRAW